MVWEIFRLFRLKSGVPKWPCHSTYIFIAIIFVHRTWHLHWRVSSSWVDYAPWPMLGWKGWTFWMFQDRTKFSTFSKLGKWSDEMQGQGNFREKVERVEEEWGKVERVEEEWGKVERVEEELNGTYLRIGACRMWEGLCICSYVNGPRTQGPDGSRNT